VPRAIDRSNKVMVENDIIKTTLKYCVYLRGLPTESLTEEEQEFMRTMEQVDAWLEAEIAEAQERKQQEIALNLLRKNIPLQVISEATGVSIEQLQSLRLQLENT
jgi:antitoxin component of RelBE/YafQ-DinJ toxin-antitoxin module